MTYALLLSCVLLLGVTPAASAQLPDVGDAVGNVLDGGSNNGGGSTGGGSSGDAGGLIGGVVGGVIDDDGENSSSGDDGGEPTTDPVTQIVETIDKTTDPVKEPVKEIVDKGSATVDDSSGGLTGGYVGGITGAVDNTVDGPGKVGDKTIKNDKRSTDRKSTNRLSRTSPIEEVFGEKFQAALEADQKRRMLDAAAVRATSDATVDEPDGSVVQQIGRVAAEAAEQMAFPVMLLLMVGAFLLGQNRVDRRDPKLALAPVDLDADLLSFT